MAYYRIIPDKIRREGGGGNDDRASTSVSAPPLQGSDPWRVGICPEQAVCLEFCRFTDKKKQKKEVEDMCATTGAFFPLPPDSVEGLLFAG